MYCIDVTLFIDVTLIKDEILIKVVISEILIEDVIAFKGGALFEAVSSIKDVNLIKD